MLNVCSLHYYCVYGQTTFKLIFQKISELRNSKSSNQMAGVQKKMKHCKTQYRSQLQIVPGSTESTTNLNSTLHQQVLKQVYKNILLDRTSATLSPRRTVQFASRCCQIARFYVITATYLGFMCIIFVCHPVLFSNTNKIVFHSVDKTLLVQFPFH